MRTIYKYPLKVCDKQIIRVPREFVERYDEYRGVNSIKGQVLHIGVQDEIPMLWCLVNPDAETVEYRIATFGTGVEIPSYYNKGNYIGSYMLHGGDIVFHVFEEYNEYGWENE